MQRRRLVDLAQVGVLCEESSEFGIEVAGLGVVEAGLLIPDVASEGEAVGDSGEFVGESEVAPGVEVVARDFARPWSSVRLTTERRPSREKYLRPSSVLVRQMRRSEPIVSSRAASARIPPRHPLRVAGGLFGFERVPAHRRADGFYFFLVPCKARFLGLSRGCARSIIARRSPISTRV